MGTPESAVDQPQSGAVYSLAAAPVLWFWASLRSIPAGNPDALIVARQRLFDAEVVNSRGAPVHLPS